MEQRGGGILGWKVGLVPTSMDFLQEFISQVRGWNFASGV